MDFFNDFLYDDLLLKLLWCSAFLWIYFLIQAILNYLFCGEVEDGEGKDLQSYPKVSIIVPARDEEKDIERAVRSFCEQDYPGDFEVIVVDDESSDDTPNILERLKKEYPHLKVIKGTGPPEGWLGKPAALECGVKEATGDWYIFSDADIIYSPELLRLSVNFVHWRRAEFLTLAPMLKTEGIMEAALMSTLTLVMAAMMPGYLIERTKTKHLSVGAGVFNLISKDAFINAGAFASIKDAVIDDVMLGRMVKQTGAKVTFAKAVDYLSVRMYEGAWETIKGFRKNIYPMIKKFPPLVLVPFVLGFILSILPYVGLYYGIFFNGVYMLPSAIALMLMHLILFVTSRIFRQPWYIAFLNPVRELGWWLIIILSFIYYYRHGGVRWRGRTFKE